MAFFFSFFHAGSNTIFIDGTHGWYRNFQRNPFIFFGDEEFFGLKIRNKFTFGLDIRVRYVVANHHFFSCYFASSRHGILYFLLLAFQNGVQRSLFFFDYQRIWENIFNLWWQSYNNPLFFRHHPLRRTPKHQIAPTLSYLLLRLVYCQNDIKQGESSLSYDKVAPFWSPNDAFWSPNDAFWFPNIPFRLPDYPFLSSKFAFRVPKFTFLVAELPFLLPKFPLQCANKTFLLAKQVFQSFMKIFAQNI